MRRRATFLVLLATCLTQGCVAALVPVAATGLAARHRMTAHGRAGPGPRERAEAVSSPAQPAVPAQPAQLAQPAAPVLEDVPADPAGMKPGKLYRGALPGPAPDGGMASPAPAPSPPVPSPAPSPPVPGARADWNDLSRHVAGVFAQAPAASVLLAPGSTLAAPRWVPCGARPLAVLVDLDAVVSPAGRVPRKVAGVLGAMETLQVAVIYLTRRGERALAGALAALPAAGLHRPEDGAVFPVAADRDAAVRAAVGARWCVVAIAGDRAADFPNKATPETAGAAWNAGWFLVPGAGEGAP